VSPLTHYCALSDRDSKTYEETRNNSNLAQDKPQEIYVLSHGFTNFQSKYKVCISYNWDSFCTDRYEDDPALVEKWDKEVWENAEDWS
jgi:hypothetical protein